MTVVSLDQLLDAGDERAERASEAGQKVQAALRLGFVWVGWAIAKLVLGLMFCVAAPFWAAGFVTSRWIIPVGKWCAAAYAVGYEQGRTPRRT